MKKEWAKWLQTIRIWWGQYTAYRINFFLQIIGPALVFFFVNYSLWTQIFKGISSEQGATVKINGMSLPEMLAYHSWTLVIGMLSRGHASFDLSNDIRLGKISTYLIYPFNFWEYHTAGFLAFQTLEWPIAFFTASILILWGLITIPLFKIVFFVLALSFSISLLWYCMQYFTGILAFWLEETWVFRVMLQIVATFLSGAIVPLNFFPLWFQNFLQYTPFPYMVYYPVKLAMGLAEMNFNVFLILLGWTLFIAGINVIIWKRGMRLYTGAGM